MQGTQVHSLVEEVRSYMLCGVAEKEKIIKMKNIKNMSKQWSPTFLTPGTSFVEDSFSMDMGVGGFRIIQTHCIYCVLYFYYYYINSASDHQALDPRCWGTLAWKPSLGPG